MLHWPVIRASVGILRIVIKQKVNFIVRGWVAHSSRSSKTRRGGTYSSGSGLLQVNDAMETPSLCKFVSSLLMRDSNTPHRQDNLTVCWVIENWLIFHWATLLHRLSFMAFGLQLISWIVKQVHYSEAAQMPLEIPFFGAGRKLGWG